jgi:hypothetical protein
MPEEKSGSPSFVRFAIPFDMMLCVLQSSNQLELLSLSSARTISRQNVARVVPEKAQ